MIYRVLKSSFTWFSLVAIVLLGIGTWLIAESWGWLHPELPSITTPDTNTSAPATVSNSETLRNVGFLLAGAIAFVLAMWRGWVAERQAETAQRGLLNERFQRGVEMLGSHVLSVRMGGVIALRRLAAEYPEQYHVQVMDLFSALVRDRARYVLDANGIVQNEDELIPLWEPSMSDVKAALFAIGHRNKSSIKFETQEQFSIDLQKTYLVGAELNGAILSGANLSESDLSWSEFSNSDLSGADLLMSDLSYCDLDGANITAARLGRVDFTQARLQKAKLQGADLCGADLTNAFLTGADLSGAILWTTYVRNACLEDADLSGTIFGRGTVSSEDVPAESSVAFTQLTQHQLDDARAYPNDPPIIEVGSFCAKTRAPLIWRGKDFMPATKTKG